MRVVVIILGCSFFGNVCIGSELGHNPCQMASAAQRDFNALPTSGDISDDVYNMVFTQVAAAASALHQLLGGQEQPSSSGDDSEDEDGAPEVDYYECMKDRLYDLSSDGDVGKRVIGQQVNSYNVIVGKLDIAE